MAKSLLALALGLIGGVLIGYLANAMGLPGWMRIIAVLLCIVGGIMLMIESKTKRRQALSSAMVPITISSQVIPQSTVLVSAQNARVESR